MSGTVDGEEAIEIVMRSSRFENVKAALIRFGRDERATDWRLVAEALLTDSILIGQVAAKRGETP